MEKNPLVVQNNTGIFN